jgi:hypothetical protein
MGIAPTNVLFNIFVGAIFISPTPTHMEKITNLNEEREKRLNALESAISYQVVLFLELHDISQVEIVWDDRSSLTELGFTLVEPDSGETLLSGERLHQDLIHHLAELNIPELRQYECNTYAERGLISFIKV